QARGDPMKRFVGSLVSVTAGCAAASYVVFLVGLFSASRTDPSILCNLAILAIWVAIVITPVWLLVFLPVYAFVPRAWPITRWEVAAPLGAVCGPLLLAIIFGDGIGWFSSRAWPFAAVAALVGAVSATVGALTLDWSRRPRSPAY